MLLDAQQQHFGSHWLALKWPHHHITSDLCKALWTLSSRKCFLCCLLRQQAALPKELPALFHLFRLTTPQWICFSLSFFSFFFLPQTLSLAYGIAKVFFYIICFIIKTFIWAVKRQKWFKRWIKQPGLREQGLITLGIYLCFILPLWTTGNALT